MKGSLNEVISILLAMHSFLSCASVLQDSVSCLAYSCSVEHARDLLPYDQLLNIAVILDRLIRSLILAHNLHILINLTSITLVVSHGKQMILRHR